MSRRTFTRCGTTPRPSSIAAGVDVRTVAGRLGHGGGGATTLAGLLGVGCRVRPARGSRPRLADAEAADTPGVRGRVSCRPGVCTKRSLPSFGPRSLAVRSQRRAAAIGQGSRSQARRVVRDCPACVGSAQGIGTDRDRTGPQGENPGRTDRPRLGEGHPRHERGTRRTRLCRRDCELAGGRWRCAPGHLMI